MSKRIRLLSQVYNCPNYSKWIQKEIDGAKAYKKPILAVNPWAQERKSSVVAMNANAIVGWNKQPIVEHIWSLYNRRAA